MEYSEKKCSCCSSIKDVHSDNSLINDIENECLSEGNFQLNNGCLSHYKVNIERLFTYDNRGLLARTMEWLSEEASKLEPDILIGAPSTGGILAALAADRLGLGFVPVKGVYRIDLDLLNYLMQSYSNKGAIIIDDVLTTGSTVSTCYNKLITYTDLQIKHVLVIWNRKKNAEQDQVIFNKIPVRSLIHKYLDN